MADIRFNSEGFGLTSLEKRIITQTMDGSHILDPSKNLCWNCCREHEKSELLPNEPSSMADFGTLAGILLRLRAVQGQRVRLGLDEP